MKAIILAAGYATRLYPLTINQPKALLPIHGRPIIDYLIDQIVSLPDISAIYVVSNHRYASQFQTWAGEHGGSVMSLQAVGSDRSDDRDGSDGSDGADDRDGSDGPDGSARRIPLLVLDDGTQDEATRLGAIGDIQFCIDTLALDDDLLVIAGDNIFAWPLLDAWCHFRSHGEDMILAQPLPDSQNLCRFAIVEVDEDGLVRHLEEKPRHPRTNLAVYAIYFYRRDTLPMFRTYLEQGHNPDAPGHFPAWLYQHKPVRVFFFEGQCYDIGTPEAYEDVMTTFPVSVNRAQQNRCLPGQQGVQP